MYRDFPSPFGTQFLSISIKALRPSIKTCSGISGIANLFADLFILAKFFSGLKRKTSSFSSL
jgi:hypothetical protein